MARDHIFSFRLRALAAAFWLTVALPAFAEQAKPADLTPEDRAEVKQIETYLNGITTVKAGFSQMGDKGVSTGTFYLDRPGKLRFDYATPQKDIIVAERRGLIWYYDARMKSVNHAPVSRTVADFLLRQDIKLQGEDVTVTDLSHPEKNIVQVVLTQTDDPEQGSLALNLSERPLQIRGWRVIDGQGRTTSVVLQNPQFGIPLDPDLFVWHDPPDAD